MWYLYLRLLDTSLALVRYWYNYLENAFHRRGNRQAEGGNPV